MPALLPILVATSHILLASDTVPKLNYEPSCRAAVETSAIASRDANSCKNDEETARASLEKVWTQYTAVQRAHCVQLTSLGGPPSYVELLTCLEMAKDASTMQDQMPASGSQMQR
jgi:hypothetical protein